MTWLKDIFSGMPKWMRNLIVFIIFLLILFVGYKTYKYFKDKADKEKLQNTVNSAKNELKELLKIQKPTYSDSTYDGWANQLQILLEGCDFDTNIVDVISIFSNIKNDVDYLKLVQSFDVREMDECGFGWATGSYNADLPTVVRKESISQLATTINAYFAKQKMKSRV